MNFKALILVAGAFVVLSTCADAKAGAEDGSAKPAAVPAPIVFREVAHAAGVDFRFEMGARGMHDYPEVMGGGVALIDFDGDGRLDLYFCNGGPIGDDAKKAEGVAAGALRKRPDPPCRLYRNLGGWRFEDATERAGAPGPSYAMGAAVGDYDGDGDPDLFVTGWRDQRLYRNNGDGTFTDATESAGLVSKLWSAAAAFADLDGDGDQDLFVVNYLDYDPAAPPFCAAPDGQRDYCGPEDFDAQPDRLYRNNGDGTFTDVSGSAGIDLPRGRGLGIVVAELTGDHRPDVYIANDSSPCWLFANRGGLRFEEIGELAGVARSGRGEAISGMGVALADLDGDGLSDLALTNFYERSTIVFRAQGEPRGTFRDASSWLGVEAATRPVLGFGLALVDFDGDGHVDLLQTNGHVLDRARLGEPFGMRPTLLRNTGAAFFQDVSKTAGAWFGRAVLGRGLAVGDLDGDGRPDLAAAALDAPAALLHNVSGSEGGRHLALELIDRHGRPAFGARVRVLAGGRVQAGQLVAGGSYLAASEPVVWFGLGAGAGAGAGAARPITTIEVDWPWGASESWLRPQPRPNGRMRLVQGTGRPGGRQKAVGGRR